MIMSVPLTLFIYQYADALLIGLDPFTVALISSAFFCTLYRGILKSLPPFLPPWRNRTIHFHPCLFGRFRLRNRRTINLRVRIRRTTKQQIARTFLPSRKHFNNSVRHRNKKTFAILHDRGCPSLFQQFPCLKSFRLLNLSFCGGNNRFHSPVSVWENKGKNRNLKSILGLFKNFD